jgi:thioredoxin 1
MATIAVTDDSFETDVLKADGPVLVDFWAEWCGPCKQIGPALEEIAKEQNGKITIAKVNIDDNPMSPSKYGVRGIPTMVLFSGGEETSRQVGAMAKTKIEQWIDSAL